jgi:putative endonuclease
MSDRPQRDRSAAEQRGQASESLAALWLRLKGYRILARRLKTHAGEIDLVAAAPFGPVCFIEVKLARRGSRFDIVAIVPRGLPVHHRDVWRPDF